MCRGNRREDIFWNDGDRRIFLETLAEVCERTGWEVCAYVLMSNHYHLIVHTPEANLMAGMKWFQGTYTKRYNFRNREWGHLFQGRYKSMVIDSEEPLWLNLQRIVEAHAGRADHRAGRTMYLKYLEERVAEERNAVKNQTEVEEYKGLCRGWCFGGREFKEELKDV